MEQTEFQQTANLSLQDVVCKSDFRNLIKDDIDRIKKELGIVTTKEIDDYNHLFDIKGTIFENSTCKRLIESKVFAGRTSIKWYKLNQTSEESKQNLIKALESEENFFNRINNISSNDVINMVKYTCIKKNDGVYMIRILIPTGYRTIATGLDTIKHRNIRNVVAYIDIEHNYLEVRAGCKEAEKVARYLLGSLGVVDYSEYKVFGNFSSSIENFKDSLYGGRFIDMSSIPDQNIELTDNQSEMLADTLGILDEYFISQDLDKFIQDIQDKVFDTNGTPFTQLLLGGMASIGMVVRKDQRQDLSSQSLYKCLRQFITTHAGYIEFEYPLASSNMYTILIGISTNNITFRSSVNEETIEYIRRKVIGY